MRMLLFSISKSASLSNSLNDSGFNVDLPEVNKMFSTTIFAPVTIGLSRKFFSMFKLSDSVNIHESFAKK